MELKFFTFFRRSNSVAYPASRTIDQSNLFKFILQHAQISVKIKISVILCQKSCLKRSFVTNYFQSKSTIRSINHLLNSLILFKDKLIEINHRMASISVKSKEWKKLTDRKNGLERYLEQIRLAIRKLRKIQLKQNLLNQFILMKIDHLIDSKYNYNELSEYLYLLLGKSRTETATKKVGNKDKKGETSKHRNELKNDLKKIKKSNKSINSERIISNTKNRNRKDEL